LEEKYYNRNTSIRMALARSHVQSKLRDEHPEIPYFHKPKQRFVISTEGAGIADETTPPCGVVFTDGSFLTIYEEWSKPDNDILSYSYHYQRGKVSVRYDMDEEPREGIPRWHIQFSGIEKVHAPCGGRVSIEQVLDMIVRQFMS
jgi:hypothetical protein